MSHRQHALEILQHLRQAGFETYWAGGCVRDHVLDRAPKDYDIATRATPDQIRALFPHTLDVGLAYGVIHVVRDHHPTEVTTFRRDLEYHDGRRPEGVEFCGPEEDARRRDFTINGLFYDPESDRVLDFVGGREDIARRLVRAIGDPEQRFREDYLRMLRAARFAAQLEFEIDPTTAEAIRRQAGQIQRISAERIQHELTRLLTESPAAGRGLRLLRELNLLSQFLPEVDRLAGQAQPPEFHPEGDVFTHTALMLDAMKQPSPTLAYSALLHDVGKPPTARRVIQPDGRERIRFDGHADVGADLAAEICRRLKLPTRVVEDVEYCVRNHMRFMDVQRMRKSTLRRLVGAPTFADELELHRLDCLSSHGHLDNHEFLVRFREELQNEPVLPAPWVTGHDLIALGLRQGPELGSWRQRAYEAQLENKAGSREELLRWIADQLAGAR